MRILKSHNDYRCGDNDQITKAYRFFKKHQDEYDELLVEADVVYEKAKVRLIKEEILNPFMVTETIQWLNRWRGSLKDYLNKADEYEIKYMMIDFKDQTHDCFKNTMILLNRHPKITFLCLSHKYPLTLKNTVDYSKWETENEIITMDFF